MKAVVLLSGGADSATCLGQAVMACHKENVRALSIYYGQKHKKEIQSAIAVAEHYGVPLYQMDLSEAYKFSDCPLLAGSKQEIEHKSYAEQLHGEEHTVATYVPFRNGLMLSTAAALALSWFPNEEVSLWYGAHADDAAGRAYPDCTIEFAQAMGAALHEGSGNKLTLITPLISLNKAGVIHIGSLIGVPYELTWSCYEGGDVHCGTCGTCIDRKNAFKKAGIPDPTVYKE